MCINIHMSLLYLGSDPRSLADQLADDLERHAKDEDFFTPASIVVPNRYVKKWLRLWLARRLDVAINLRFQPLEEALWDLLKVVDPAQAPTPPEAVDDNTYRLIILSILLEIDDPDLAPLQRYLQLIGARMSRLSCRRAWYLADRLGGPPAAITNTCARTRSASSCWLKQQLGLGNANAYQQLMERGQRAVFLHITPHEPDGKRKSSNDRAHRTFKTFPQYAMELMTLPREPGGLTPRLAEPSRLVGRVIHFFGFTQVSELHARTIAWLGQAAFDIRFYHLNVLASRYDGDLQKTAQELCQSSNDAESTDRGREGCCGSGAKRGRNRCGLRVAFAQEHRQLRREAVAGRHLGAYAPRLASCAHSSAGAIARHSRRQDAARAGHVAADRWLPRRGP